MYIEQDKVVNLTLDQLAKSFDKLCKARFEIFIYFHRLACRVKFIYALLKQICEQTSCKLCSTFVSFRLEEFLHNIELSAVISALIYLNKQLLVLRRNEQMVN